MLHFDPQENVFMPFFNNLNTRIIEKDRFVSQSTVPGLTDDGDMNFSVHPANRNPQAAAAAGRSDLGGIQNVGDIRQFSGTTALFS
jgi:hypothetical protein